MTASRYDDIDHLELAAEGDRTSPKPAVVALLSPLFFRLARVISVEVDVDVDRRHLVVVLAASRKVGLSYRRARPESPGGLAPGEPKLHFVERNRSASRGKKTRQGPRKAVTTGNEVFIKTSYTENWSLCDSITRVKEIFF